MTQKGKHAQHRTGEKVKAAARQDPIHPAFLGSQASTSNPPAQPSAPTAPAGDLGAGQHPRTCRQKLLTQKRGPSTKHQDHIPKGRQPRPAQDAPRFGVDLTGKVGSARAAPPASGLPNPGPRILPLRPPPRPRTPAVPGLPRGHPAVATSPPAAGGAAAPRPPHNPAREATPREEGRRPPRASPHTQLHSHAPPSTRTPPSIPLESRVPQQHILPSQTVSPRPSPAALPRPQQARPEY